MAWTTDNNMVSYDVFGIEFSMPKAEIEQRIMKMSREAFVRYAKQFIPNPYYPCSHYAEPSWFKSREEWEKYEIEGADISSYDVRMG